MSSKKYLIKGDISGIQEFIFLVKSDGASKSLKARSFFLTAATKITIELLKQQLQHPTLAPIYDGGGNFGLIAPVANTDVIDQLQADINKALSNEDLVLVMGYVPFDGDYAAATKVLDKKILPQRKLSVYKNQPKLWTPTPRPEPEKSIETWKDLTKKIALAKDFDLLINPKAPLVDENGYAILGTQYRIITNGTSGALVGIMDNKLPLVTEKLLNHPAYGEVIKHLDKDEEENYKYRHSIKPEEYPLKALKDTENDDILEFSALAGFAHVRTGTRKLGVLKMDVDGLGVFFENIKTEADAKKYSNLMKDFFSKELYQLWQGTFAGNERFQDNIYIVFAGGDDLMMVGAWDAVFEFASVVRKAFVDYATEHKMNHPQTDKPLTISAGLLLLDPKYPIIRFAQLAEEALDDHAKPAMRKLMKERLKKVKEGKLQQVGDVGHVSIFGQVLTWSDFDRMYRVKNQLIHLLTKAQKPEARRLLERIKQSGAEFLEVQERALKHGRVRVPKVWRLDYFLRNIHKSNKDEVGQLFDDFSKALITEYNRALLNATISGEAISPAVFPVAARWAEFSTRISQPIV